MKIFNGFLNIFRFPAFIYLFFNLSCDYIEDPYIPVPPVPVVDTVQKVQRVLLEEYTGHTCGNCPGAAATAIGMQQNIGDRLIILSIHDNSNFGWPLGPPYNYDFRTSAGIEYAATFNIISHPMALINRIDFPDNHIKTPGSWSAAVDSLLQISPQAFIRLENSYVQTGRQLTTKVKIDILDTLSGEFKLLLLFIEDSIQRAQTDYTKTPEDVLDYWHRHTLRAVINSSWGDIVITSSLPGETIDTTYSYLVPDIFKGLWNLNTLATRDEQCSVIAILYDNTTPSPSYRIINVAEEKIL